MYNTIYKICIPLKEEKCIYLYKYIFLYLFNYIYLFRQSGGIIMFILSSYNVQGSIMFILNCVI